MWACGGRVAGRGAARFCGPGRVSHGQGRGAPIDRRRRTVEDYGLCLSLIRKKISRSPPWTMDGGLQATGRGQWRASVEPRRPWAVLGAAVLSLGSGREGGRSAPSGALGTPRLGEPPPPPLSHPTTTLSFGSGREGEGEAPPAGRARLVGPGPPGEGRTGHKGRAGLVRAETVDWRPFAAGTTRSAARGLRSVACGQRLDGLRPAVHGLWSTAYGLGPAVYCAASP